MTTKEKPPAPYGAVDIGDDGKARLGDWIQTFRKKKFHAADPRVEDIDIEDIAHALSQQCRFSGHTSRFYSVAEHSVRVALICPREHRLWGLLHDASEAYIVDIPRPFKHMDQLREYREIEAVVQGVVCDRFGLPREMPRAVKLADEILLGTEARDLMGPLLPGWVLREAPLPEVVAPWPPEQAKYLFLSMFKMLTD